MADPRTDFFASGAGDAENAATGSDPRTSFFASGGSTSQQPPITYDAALFKKRVGRDPEPAELANFKASKGVGWAGDPTQGKFTAAQAAIGAGEDALSLGTGIAASVPAAVGYMAGAAGLGDSKQNARAVNSALTYQPRTQAGQAGMAGIKQVASGPVEVAAHVADQLDPSGRGVASDTVRDVAERVQDVTPLLGVPSIVRGVGAAAGSAGSRVLNSVHDVEGSPSAQQVADQAAGASNQSMGAAAASPRLSNASPQLQQAIVNAAQRTGGAINPDALARHLEGDTLPVPVQLTEGEALGDVTRISNERNNPQLADFYNKRNGKLKENLQAIRDEVGPDVFTTNAVEHADTLIKAYQDKAAAADANTAAKYQALRDANNGDFPADPKQLVTNATNALKKEMLSSKAPKDVMASLQEAADRGNITLDEFETARTRLAQIARGSSDGQERYAAGVVRQEMEKLPITGNAAKLKGMADDARNAARTQFQALEADPAYKAAVEGSVKADRFVQKFITGGTRDNVALMRQNLAHDPIAQQTMGVAAIDSLRDAARVNPDGTRSFSQAGFNKQRRALDVKIGSLLSPAHAEMVENLGNVARYTQEQPAGHFINNSKTFVAAAAEGAKGLAEHAANAKTFGIGGTATRTFLQKRAAKAEVRRITAPGAGLDVLEEKQ